MSRKSDGWTPTEVDMTVGREGYIDYAIGVAILRDPDREVASIVAPETDEMSDEIIITRAEQLMWHGLVKVIKCANPPELRSPITKLEFKHESALPNIEAIVDSVCDPKTREYRTLKKLDPLFVDIPPNPLKDNRVYKYIAHSRREKLKTTELLAPFYPASKFSALVEGRKLNPVNRK